MSIDFPPEISGDKPAERGYVKIWWLFVLLLLVALLAVLYRSTGLFAPSYRAVGMYHPPTYRPLPDQGGKPEAAPQPEGPRPGQKTPDKATPPPPPKPLPTPSAPQLSPPRPVPATETKPEGKPVQKELVKPPFAPAAPAKPQAKAIAPPPPAATTDAAGTSVPAKTAQKAMEPEDTCTLLIGEFAANREMKKLRAMLKKLGVAPVRETKVNRVDTMHRLHLGDFDSYQSADAELQKLRQQDVDGFVLKGNGNYAVYAGSFLQEKRAVAEQQRLAGKEIKVNIRTAQVPVSLTRVTAGTFPGNEAALKKAALLEKQGVTAQVVKLGD